MAQRAPPTPPDDFRLDSALFAKAIEALAPNTGGAVALKAPLTLDFEARDGDSVLASATGIALERRQGVALLLRGSDGNYELVTAPNAIAD